VVRHHQNLPGLPRLGGASGWWPPSCRCLGHGRFSSPLPSHAQTIPPDQSIRWIRHPTSSAGRTTSPLPLAAPAPGRLPTPGVEGVRRGLRCVSGVPPHGTYLDVRGHIAHSLYRRMVCRPACLRFGGGAALGEGLGSACALKMAAILPTLADSRWEWCWPGGCSTGRLG